VKKTTNEQFDLLKSEMSVHLAAARGYGMGADRATVDAEWREIVEKLNAIGPPHRSLTEWKKVWSDIRLRNKKRSLGKCSIRSKKTQIETEEDLLMEALNSSTSIYGSHINTTESDNGIQHNGDYYADNTNQQQQYYNDNNYNYNESCEQSMYEANTPKFNEQFNKMEHTLNAVQTQLNEQNKLMEHLLQMTTNLAFLMERQTQAYKSKEEGKFNNTVWSDYRLRHLKVLSRDFIQKQPKKHRTTAKKNKVSSNKTNSITYIAVDEEKPCLMQLNLPPESQHSAEEEYYHPEDPFKDDERNSSKEQYFNSSIHSLEEHEDFYGNDSNNYKSYCQSPYNNIQHNSSNSGDEKLNYLGQTLGTIELQIKNQNIMMEHLSKITENLSVLMERHVTNLEKQNQIMERQLRVTERHNMFLRRQEARRKVLSKCKNFELQKS
ncbi:hypothetical protein DOY81_008285, partial [Sarcophaga bullata]